MPIGGDELGVNIVAGYVANYSALPAASSVSGKFYWVQASQGTKWLPGSMGGTYYPNGIYRSNGSSWEYVSSPNQATQSDVDAGIITDQFVTPSTLKNSTQWATKEDYVTPSFTNSYYRGDKTFQPLTTAVVPDSTNRRYMTDTQQTNVGNLTGVNSGDETTVTIKTKLGFASASQDGYLLQTDWNTFNNKESAIAPGTNAQYWRGDKSWQNLTSAVVTELTNLYFTTARVLATALAGLNTSLTGTITSSDTVLTAFGKIQSAITTNTSNIATNTANITTNTASITSNSAAILLKQDLSGKDASGGYVGLTGFVINFYNALGTFKSQILNVATAIRIYTFPDKDMTIAGIDDCYFNIPVGFVTSFGPADNTTYYFGPLIAIAPTPSPGANRRFIVNTALKCDIIGFSFTFQTTVAATSEVSTFLLVNLTQGVSVTMTSSLVLNAQLYVDLSGFLLSFNGGDVGEIRWNTPSWVTNPSAVQISGNLICRRKL